MKKEKEEYKGTNVFIKDKQLLHNFETNDKYKNAFANLIIQYAMKYFQEGFIYSTKI
jgi:hypothetical protein